MTWPHVVTPRVAIRRRRAWLAADFPRSFFALALALAICTPALAEKASTPVLPGGNSKEPINIDAAKLDYFDKEQKLVYTGDVVATQGDSTLKATALVLYLSPKSGAADQPGVPSSSSQLRRMEASGPVTLVSKGQVGTGDSGIYEKAQNAVYLIGNVTLTQGPNVTKGDKLVYDLTTGQAVVTGHVKSMFMPSNTPNSAPESGQSSGTGGAPAPPAAGQGPVRKKPAKAVP